MRTLVLLVSSGQLFARTSAASPLGINLGNVLEAPHEGDWAPPAEQYYFTDYLQAGFNFVRVPVRWDLHMSTAPPYSIDPSWLARVHEVTGWGLSLNMTVLINSHHDDWLDNATTFEAELPRFVSLWSQVSASFASAPPNLLFEVFNEFHEITVEQANQVYASVVPIMRASGGGNAVRPIYLGGLSWMSPYWILANPDAIVFPQLPGGGVDPNLRLETHSYDPYSFCGVLPPTQQTWGTPADVQAVNDMYANMSAWSASHHHTDLLMGEAGCHVQAPSRPDRLSWYATVGAAARRSYSGRLCIWDDDGDFKIYDRQNRTWDEGVLNALGM